MESSIILSFKLLTGDGKWEWEITLASLYKSRCLIKSDLFGHQCSRSALGKSPWCWPNRDRLKSRRRRFPIAISLVYSETQLDHSAFTAQCRRITILNISHLLSFLNLTNGRTFLRELQKLPVRCWYTRCHCICFCLFIFVGKREREMPYRRWATISFAAGQIQDASV